MRAVGEREVSFMWVRRGRGMNGREGQEEKSQEEEEKIMTTAATSNAMNTVTVGGGVVVDSPEDILEQCQKLMDGYTDAGATTQEKKHYAECVQIPTRNEENIDNVTMSGFILAGVCAAVLIITYFLSKVM